MNNKNKILDILQALSESKKEYKYLILINDKGEETLKLKTDAKDKNFINLLDKVFDLGYTVKEISKKDFDSN